jgi:phosphorylcholine metabolism protein LicD
MNFVFIIIYIVISIYIIYKVVDACYVKDTEQKIINRVYYLLDEISMEFDKNGVEYIMVGGTLLGSVRHGGMIPWDDDGDLCVLNKTPEEIIEILKPLKDKNILSRIHKYGNLVISSVNNQIGLVDIFFMKKTNSKYKFMYPYNVKYSNEWFYEDDLYPIKKYIFGPLVLKGPNKYNEYLIRTYNKWEQEAVKWNHKAIIHQTVKLKN